MLEQAILIVLGTCLILVAAKARKHLAPNSSTQEIIGGEELLASHDE